MRIWCVLYLCGICSKYAETSYYSSISCCLYFESKCFTHYSVSKNFLSSDIRLFVRQADNRKRHLPHSESLMQQQSCSREDVMWPLKQRKTDLSRTSWDQRSQLRQTPLLLHYNGIFVLLDLQFWLLWSFIWHNDMSENLMQGQKRGENPALGIPTSIQ
jgi:hypothetical protein